MAPTSLPHCRIGAGRGRISLVVHFVFRRVLALACLLVAVATLSYGILCLSPIDPIRAYIGDDVMQISAAQRHQIELRWGLGEPPLDRYRHWLVRLGQGDLGRSVIYNRPVAVVIAEKSLLSAGLMALAWGSSGLIGFVLGLVAGAARGSLVDRGIRLFSYFVASAPAFWVGMLLLTTFSLWLGILPPCCAATPGADPRSIEFGDWLTHVLLPAITLSVTGIAGVLLHTRQKTIDALRSDYATLARAQGASAPSILWHHGLRNVSLPAVNVHFASFSELFGGAVLAEQVFAYPGLGQATVQAGLRGDVPLLLGIVLFSAVFVFSGNAVADLLCRLIDPRLRMRVVQ